MFVGQLHHHILKIPQCDLHLNSEMGSYKAELTLDRTLFYMERSEEGVEFVLDLSFVVNDLPSEEISPVRSGEKMLNGHQGQP